MRERRRRPTTVTRQAHVSMGSKLASHRPLSRSRDAATSRWTCRTTRSTRLKVGQDRRSPCAVRLEMQPRLRTGSIVWLPPASGYLAFGAMRRHWLPRRHPLGRPTSVHPHGPTDGIQKPVGGVRQHFQIDDLRRANACRGRFTEFPGRDVVGLIPVAATITIG